MPQCLIAIGCNQGDCQQSIKNALRKIDDLPNTRLIAASQFQKTRPIGDVDRIFLNGAATIETGLEPDELMQHLLRLESEAGRDRDRNPGNRPLDLDLLLFDQLVLSTPVLTVPHPRMSFRRFVLEPAAEIAPDMMHPQLQTTLAELLQRIRKERNVVAVLLPESFDASLIDLKPVGLVHWVLPGSQRELLASLRNHVSVNQCWLVVIGREPELISQLKDAIKLVVTVNASANHLEELRRLFRGPQWDLGTLNASEIKEHVLTAIDSLQPVV